MSKKEQRHVRADAQTFRQCLKIMGWSQAEAARQLGVHNRQRVGDWIHGRRPVPAYVTSALAFRVNQELNRRGI